MAAFSSPNNMEMDKTVSLSEFTRINTYKILQVRQKF